MTRDQLLADIAALEKAPYVCLSRILPILRTLAELSDEQRAQLVKFNEYMTLNLRLRADDERGIDLRDASAAHRIAAKLFSGEP